MKIDPEKYQRLLAKRCLTTRDLCKLSGLKPPTVNSTVRGKNNKPATIGKIARALNVSIEELVVEEGGEQ